MTDKTSFDAVASGHGFMTLPCKPFSTAAALTTALLTLSSPALTQEDSEPDTGLQIEEVLVTAQKRAENIRDVPISITALGDDFIDDAAITDVGELSQFVPNMVINATPYTGFVTMRGLGSGNNKGFERSVAVVVDGVYYGRQDYLFEALADTERLEVLRGPQGTLFGKNAIAGALNITTGIPTEEFTGKISVFGNDDGSSQRYRLAVGGPIIEGKVLARAYLEKEDRLGPIRNTGAELDRDENPHIGDVDPWLRSKETELGRFSLSFPNLIDGLDLKLNATTAKVFGNSTAGELTAATDATLDVYRRYDPKVEADAHNQQTSRNEPEPSDRDGNSYVIQADYELGESVVTFVWGQSEFTKLHILDADFGPSPALILAGDDAYEQESFELRIASGPGTIEYVAGLYHFTSDLLGTGATELETGPSLEIILADRGFPSDVASLIPLATSVLGIPAGLLPGNALDTYLTSDRFFDQATTSKAVFGQVTWNISDALALMAGLRYSEEEKSVHATLSHNNALSTAIFSQFLNEQAYDEKLARKETDLSPKISLRYSINDDINAYFTYATAFKAGGFNEAAVESSNLEFEPEEAETFEAGVKMRLLNGAANLNIGLFHTEFENLQISLFNGTNFEVGNAATAESRGIEIEGQILPTRWLSLNASMAHLYARYISFPNAQCPATSTADSCDISGRELTRAPEWEATIISRVNLSELLPVLRNRSFKLGFGVDAAFRDQQYFSTDLDPLDQQKAHTEVNANIRLSGINDDWSLTAIGRNITARSIQAHGQDVPLQAGSHFGTMQQLDRYFLEFQYQW